MTSHLAHAPLAATAHAVGHAVSSGQATSAIGHAPPSLRSTVGGAAQTGFVDGLNAILLIGAIVVCIAAATPLALIRQRDFVHDPVEGDGPEEGVVAEPLAA